MSVQRMVIIFGLLILSAGLLGCSGETKSDVQREAEEKANTGEVYQPVNDLERQNYNQRQEISDDPSTILWCTFAFPNAGDALITVPVVGKLTSGGKRPYAVEWISTGTDDYFPEIPGPDGMYGSSGEYRYGFGPMGAAEYYDFYQLPLFCTTLPYVWHREETTILSAVDEDLLAVQREAQGMIRSGRPEEAQRMLNEAIAAVRAEGED